MGSNGNSWHSWPCSTASTERVYVSSGTTASPPDNTDRNSLFVERKTRESSNIMKEKTEENKRTAWKEERAE